MISFEHPWLLAGALATLIPLIIHLFDRRKARPLKFAAIEFVLRSQKRTASKLRLRRLLLYALRTLLFLAIPLALARPFRPVIAATQQSAGPRATAIVLDASLSMRDGYKGESLFDSARDLARGALAELGPDEPVTVLVCKPSADPATAPSFDRQLARKRLDEAQPSYQPVDLNGCIQAAATTLGESPVLGKRIIVATDLTLNGLRLEGPAPRVTTPKGDVQPEVVLLDAARGAAELPNAGITDLRVEPEPALGSRGFAFTFTVRNYSTKPVADLTAQLKVGDHVVAKGVVSVPAGGATPKTLSFRFPEGGWVHGQVELAHDDLAEDDARPFTLKVPREVQALVVDGAPAALRFQDEAFFVDAALQAPGSPVKATTIDVDSFNAAPLPAGLDVVVLLNVPGLQPGRVGELLAFAQNGGGLLISLGPNAAEPDAYNATMSPLLPRPLRLVKTATDRDHPDATAHLASVLWSHPALGIFTGEAREGLTTARTTSYALLEPGAPGEVAVLASYDDGAPALVESQKGKGRVVMFTSSTSRAWSDLCIRPAFLPMMQRLTGYLAGALDEREVRATRVGEPHPLELPKSAARLPSVAGPDGKARTVIAAQGSGSPMVTGTDLPGLYVVTGDGVEPGSLDFAVTVDPSEGNLARHDAAALQAYFGEGTRTQTGSATDAGSRPQTPAWTGLLVLAALVLFAEGGVLFKS